jgi:hypothetical protein
MPRNFVSLFGSGGDLLPVAAGGGAVAFDNATVQSETSSDGVLSFSHTATGSNLGAFVVFGTWTSDSGVDACTYNGVAMAPLWSLAGGTDNSKRCWAYYLANNQVPAGASTVEVNLSAATTGDIFYVCVITMTGVHQTTPVGTPVTQTINNDTPVAIGVTVGSVGANDFICDGWYLVQNAIGIPTVNAGQTSRAAVSNGSDPWFHCFASTQPGSEGGVMSWSNGGPSYMLLAGGAVAFKPA